MRSLTSLLLSIMAAMPMLAQEPAEKADTQPLRPVYSAYMLEAGTGHLADTYLTPLHYNGVHLGLLYERTQAMKFSPESWVQQLVIGLDGDITENPAKNANMYYGALQASWRMMRRWQLPYNLTLGFGGAATLDGGCLYLDRNGNNPAQAICSITVDASAYAAWKHRLGKMPFTLRYQVVLPVTGAFFAPDYGQLYYQIYLGDRDHLAHAAWWGNFFRMDNMLSADLHFGATTLRLGYRAEIFSSKVNDIVSRNISHSFVLGVCTEWIALRPGKKLPDARIISAY